MILAMIMDNNNNNANKANNNNKNNTNNNNNNSNNNSINSNNNNNGNNNDNNDSNSDHNNNNDNFPFILLFYRASMTCGFGRITHVASNYEFSKLSFFFFVTEHDFFSSISSSYNKKISFREKLYY